MLIANRVSVRMAEDSAERRRVEEAIRDVKPDAAIVATVLRPRPLAPIHDARVAFFSAAPERAHGRLAEHLETDYGATVVHVSGNLGDRPALRAELAAIDADVYLTELKGAAIDVVAEHALERGAELVFADNDVVPLPGQPDLDGELWSLVEQASRAPVAS